jgi:hypothetical protein
MIKKSRRIFLLILIVSLLLSSANLSYGETQDMGFENDLSSWTVNGDISLITESAINASTNVWTVLPRYEQMAQLIPTGASGAFSNMADTFSLSTESRNYITGLFPRITNATYIYRDIELSAGEEFTMGWNYVSTDYEPFNDIGLFLFSLWLIGLWLFSLDLFSCFFHLDMKPGEPAFPSNIIHILLNLFKPSF